MLVCPSGFFSLLPVPIGFSSGGLACLSLILSRWSVFLFDNLSIVHLIRLCVYGYPSICEDGNEMWSDRRLDLQYAILHAPLISALRPAEYLISGAGLSSGQRWAAALTQVVCSRSYHQSANKDAHKFLIYGLTGVIDPKLNAECGFFPLRASSLRFYSDSFSTASTSELYLASLTRCYISPKCSPSC